MLSLLTKIKATKVFQRILAQHYGGIYKRIDENRELLMLLQAKAPDFLTENPWVENWIKSTDGFLLDLEKVSSIEDPVFGPKDSPNGYPFPRVWPTTISSNGEQENMQRFQANNN